MNDVTLLGEIHGTKETPLVAKKYLLQADTVCLEIPSDQQVFVDENRLSESRFFSRKSEDGRSTVEYQALVEELIGAGVRVVCVDVSSLWGLFRGRDKVIARNIYSARSGRTVALLGLVHAANKRVWIGPVPASKPVSVYLREWGVRVRTVALAPSSGECFNHRVKEVSSFAYTKYFDEVVDVGVVSAATPRT